MSASSTTEQQYFRTIEDVFIRLRGTPFLLSPRDWRLTAQWYEAGIPVELVCRALEDLFDRRLERGEKGRVQSLKYCASAVEDAWREQRELGSASQGSDDYSVDIPGRLAALAESLPPDLAGRDSWARRIGGIEGSAQAVEDVLVSLDREMLEAVARDLGVEERRVLESEVESALSALEGRVSDEVLSADRERLSREAVRRQVGLPLLSLFSPDARGSG